MPEQHRRLRYKAALLILTPAMPMLMTAAGNGARALIMGGCLLQAIAMASGAVVEVLDVRPSTKWLSKFR